MLLEGINTWLFPGPNEEYGSSPNSIVHATRISSSYSRRGEYFGESGYNIDPSLGFTLQSGQKYKVKAITQGAAARVEKELLACRWWKSRRDRSFQCP